MRSDSRRDRLLLWVAGRVPSWAPRLHRIVNDHRTTQALHRHSQMVDALRDDQVRRDAP